MRFQNSVARHWADSASMMLPFMPMCKFARLKASVRHTRFGVSSDPRCHRLAENLAQCVHRRIPLASVVAIADFPAPGAPNIHNIFGDSGSFSQSLAYARRWNACLSSIHHRVAADWTLKSLFQEGIWLHLLLNNMSTLRGLPGCHRTTHLIGQYLTRDSGPLQSGSCLLQYQASSRILPLLVVGQQGVAL